MPKYEQNLQFRELLVSCSYHLYLTEFANLLLNSFVYYPWSPLEKVVRIL